MTNKMDLLVYESESMKINYPKDWQKFDMGKGAVLFLYPGKEMTYFLAEKFIIMSPSVEEFSKIPSMAGKPLNLENIANATIEGAIKKGAVVNKSDVTELKIDGVPAKSIILITPVGDTKLKIMQIVAVKDQKAHMVSYSASEENFGKYYKLAEEVFNSIKIK